jgi:hypothetical protein
MARPSLSGRVTGILTVPGEHPWGVHLEPGFSWEWARSEGGRQPYLLVGDDSFVPQLPAGTPVDIHLVEVEIDPSRPARGPHVVVSAVRVLDGTSQMQRLLGDTLRELRGRFDQAVQSSERELASELAAAKEKLRADPGGTLLHDLEPADIVVYRPAWRADRRQLEVLFAYKRQGGFWIKSQPAATSEHVKHAPPPAERGVSYAVTMAARYTVDTTGATVGTEVFPPSQSARPWEAPSAVEKTWRVSGRVVSVSRICGGGAAITRERLDALPPPQPLAGKQLLIVAGHQIVAQPIRARVTAGPEGRFTTQLSAGTWCIFDAARKPEKTASAPAPLTAAPTANVDAACLAAERLRCDALVTVPDRDIGRVEVAFYERCPQVYNQPFYRGPMPP